MANNDEPAVPARDIELGGNGAMVSQKDLSTDDTRRNAVDTKMTELPWGARWTNIFLLSFGWCMAVSAFFIQVSNTPTIVLGLTGKRGTATLSLGTMVLVAAVSAVPGSLMMAKYGRRIVYLTGGLAALAGTAVQAVGIDRGSTSMIILGTIPQGYMYALANSFRFAAQEFAAEHEKPKALAMLVAGAVLSAVVGPETSRHARDMISGSPFTGAYVVLGIVFALQLLAVGVLAQWHLIPSHRPPPKAAPAPGDADAVPLSAVEAPRGHKEEEDSRAYQGPSDAQKRPEGGILDTLWSFLRDPGFTLPMVATAWAYVWMAALMSATPVVMAGNGRSLDQRITVIEVHLVSMFLPAFWSGDWVKKIGPYWLLLIGFALEGCATAIYYAPDALWVYFVSMTIMGVGWNLAYVAASVIGAKFMAGIKDPSSKTAAQGLFDTAVLAFLGVGMTTIGYSIDDLGWHETLSYYLGIGLVFCVASAVPIIRQLRGTA